MKEANTLQTHKEQKQQAKQATIVDKLLTLPQYLIPHHLLSLAMYYLTRCEIRWFKNAFIRFIIKLYKVNIEEAADKNITNYPCFNAFFTRELREGARPIAKSAIVSPVDGAISQIGAINRSQVIQAKGHHYNVLELLGGDDNLARHFEQGQFATIYLSPKDYHRIHMPLTGTLQKMRYIPGKLFSVSPRTARTVPNLFARNERVVTTFDTEFGPMVMVLVGAIFVGSMETVWSGQVTPPYGKAIAQWTYTGKEAITLKKGQEMGRFNMGSTVILLMTEQAPNFDEILAEFDVMKLGQAMT